MLAGGMATARAPPPPALWQGQAMRRAREGGRGAVVSPACGKAKWPGCALLCKVGQLDIEHDMVSWDFNIVNIIDDGKTYKATPTLPHIFGSFGGIAQAGKTPQKRDKIT